MRKAVCLMRTALQLMPNTWESIPNCLGRMAHSEFAIPTNAAQPLKYLPLRLPAGPISPATISRMPTHPKAARAFKLKDIAIATGSVKRLRIFLELGKGEPLPTSEIARRVGISPNGASKILNELHKAGLADRGYGKLYRIPPHLFVPGEPAVDLGPVVLRLDYKESPAA